MPKVGQTVQIYMYPLSHLLSLIVSVYSSIYCILSRTVYLSHTKVMPIIVSNLSPFLREFAAMVPGVVEDHQADVVFVVEGTAINGAYLNDLKANYIVPTLQ